jgi:hypothetical protein
VNVYVTIGNSDGKLGHEEWDEFIRTVKTILYGYGHLIGDWRRDAWPYVNAIFCFELMPSLVVDGDARYDDGHRIADKGLRSHLARIAVKYRQDSIAFALCEPEMIKGTSNA